MRRQSKRLLTLALAALLALSALAPVGQAREREGAQAVTAAATRAAEKEAAKALREAERNARREARHSGHAPSRQERKERENAVVAITCSAVTLSFRNFAEAPGNTIEETLKIQGKATPLTYAFDGSSSVQTIRIVGPIGHYLIDIHARWRTNGLSGSFDIPGNVTCTPNPAFTIQKLQQIEGSATPATSETLPGQVGQTVDYRIEVANTGNLPLVFAPFKDPHCEAGTIAGGPAGEPVQPYESFTYTCSHKLNPVDQLEGVYSNKATLTATPEGGNGSPLTRESNLVRVTPIAPAPEEGESEEPPAEETTGTKPVVPPGSTTTTTTTPTGTTGTTPTPSSGVLGTASTGSGTPKSGVLGFSSATVPALKGPQGCVRSAFTASIRSAGVSSVVFYLDARRLSRLTSKNAHKGLLSIKIDPSRLKVGAHHVTAKITMRQSSPTAKAARATRALTVIRCHTAVLTPHFTG